MIPALVVDKFSKVHGQLYDYSLADYKNRKTKIKILCRIHGEFEQLPSNHLKGSGCSLCGQKGRPPILQFSSQEEFIKAAIKLHGLRYDYSKVKFINGKVRVTIGCPKHGDFEQTPHTHLAYGNSIHSKGHGCPQCGGSNCHTLEQFIDVANKIHENKYSYSKSLYVNRHSKLEIICVTHGSFFQTPSNHILNKTGCPHCADVAPLTLEEFVRRAKKVHGDLYDYSRVQYTNNRTKVEIICPQHGAFWQTPSGHTDEQGCPECSRFACRTQLEIYEFTKTLDPGSISEFPIPNSRKSLDVFLPAWNLGIEYDGLRWHGEKISKRPYNLLDKTKVCDISGIRLLHILENEWMNKDKQEIWKSIISSKLGKNQRIAARKCKLKEVPMDVAKSFIEENHLQSWTPAKVCLGLYFQDELKAIMTFGQPRFKKDIEWELIRFASQKFITVVGGASRLFSCFIKKYNPNSVITYADRRYSTGRLYQALGFDFSHNCKPNYWYFKSNSIKNVFSRQAFQKHKLEKKLNVFDPLLSEPENMRLNGYDRIFDCGSSAWVYTRLKAK